MPSSSPARAALCPGHPQPTRQPANPPTRRLAHPRAGITLVEMLVSVGLTILLMSILAQVFTVVAGTVSLERTLREVDQRVRSAQAVLRSDLEGVTAVMNPPRDPADGEGYFEYEENTTVVEWDTRGSTDAIDNDGDGMVDEADEFFFFITGVDTDDVIQFTTRIGRGRQRPFVGRGAGPYDPSTQPFDPMGPPFVPTMVESQVAEVAYFLRESRPRSGTTPVLYTLYRRQLLVEGEQPLQPTLGNYRADASWYWQYDLSARPNRKTDAGGNPITLGGLPLVNTLGDLTLRENRFAHDPHLNPVPPFIARWPHLPISFDDSANPNGIYDPLDVLANQVTWFGRPLLRETASGDPAAGGWDSPDNHPSNNIPYLAPADGNNDGLLDGFRDPRPSAPSPGDQPRFAEDVLLTNVLSFNVEAWDPGAPIFEEITATGRVRIDPSHPRYRLLEDRPGMMPLMPGDIPIVGYGAYVDLGYGLPLGNPPGAVPWAAQSGNGRFIDTFFPKRPAFWHNGDRRTPLLRTYDTWANYGNDGVDNDEVFPTGEGNVREPFPNMNRLVADGINNDNDFGLDAMGNPTIPFIDEGIDDGFNNADDDNDRGFWLNGLDDDGDGSFDEPDEWINETTVSAGPGYDDWIDNDNLAPISGGPPPQGLDFRELLEAESPPPYPVPLQGIRIRIRVIEPASQQTREFTLIQSFRTE